jgi:predicted metalloendopeptidase
MLVYCTKKNLATLFQVRFYRFALRRNLELVDRDVDRKSWPRSFPPIAVNAFYLYSRNLVRRLFGGKN